MKKVNFHCPVCASPIEAVDSIPDVIVTCEACNVEFSGPNGFWDINPKRASNDPLFSVEKDVWQCDAGIKLHFGDCSILIGSDLEDFDRLIENLQRMRSELKDNLGVSESGEEEKV